MILYKTLKEKAEEWHVSLRHLQYLCNKGKLEGAIKKAGVWFVPDNAQLPGKYKKSRNGHFNFTGTKKKIFNCAIKLFQSRGYEAVSIKDIADAAGITQSSVYNHFKSKQKILGTIYDFYCYYFLKDRPLLEDIEPILQSGSLADIIGSVRYRFGDDHFDQMTDITTILFHRYVIDDRAREMTRTLMIGEGVRFVEAVLGRAVEIGRIAPMDTKSMAMIVNSIRIYTLCRWLSSPEKAKGMQLEEDELNLFELASRILTDIKFSDNDSGGI